MGNIKKGVINVLYALLILAGGYVIFKCGGIIGFIICAFIPGDAGWITTSRAYLVFLGCWIIFLLIFLIFKHLRPMFKALGTYSKGNTPLFFLLGLLVGFVDNFICILIALAQGCIKVEF